ncbi:MAG: hypothetical protein IPM76_16025 [Chloroflexi bacterium]|nr:hypothetical protein [Chloroflexota bacterium]
MGRERPLGVCTTIAEFRTSSGLANCGAYSSIAGICRADSQGNDESPTSPRTNAYRRSPSSPCHTTCASANASPCIDFTGYRYSAFTTPTSWNFSVILYSDKTSRNL